jgi:hypothetical protein
MSSSIPLAYLTARIESDGQSVGKAGRRSNGGRVSPDLGLGDDIRSPGVSSSSLPQGEVSEDANETNTQPTASIQHVEEGYGWVVTGCKSF